MSNQPFTASKSRDHSASENMKLRSSLMSALKEFIIRSRLNQVDAAKLFGITQPRVSNLMRGKTTLFGLDTLVNMAACAGLQVQISVLMSA